MNINKKLIISIILTFVLLTSGTYAYIYFYTEKTSVTMMVDGDRISFDAGENITVNGIMPVYTMEEGVVKEVEIYKEDGSYTAGIDLYLNLKSWPKVFSSSSLKWALLKNSNLLSSGTFSGTKEGDDIKLTINSQEISLEQDKDKYKLYIWIDAYTESGINIMNQSFTVSLYGHVTFYDENDVVEKVEPNAPELADGMIPIRYDYMNGNWQKADSSNIKNNWYDYDNKMWANAVLVTSESREGYMNASVGTTVNEEDILAYYVWIPRYKYLLFNVNSEEIDPIEIQIEFEKTTDQISQGDENGQYLSHPSFWWDINSDGDRPTDGSEELSGIWVGKFENGGNNTYPLIKPNIYSADAKEMNTNFSINSKINDSYYFTDLGLSQIDSHMIKNTDWGCVSYLSHSKYGKNSQVINNDNSNSITGRYGNYTYNDYYVSNGVVTSSKVPGMGGQSSTTGNVYGIYDMAGGRAEFVMMLIKTSATNDTPYLSGTGFKAATLPESKYYDLYDYGTSSTDFSRRILGDATGETYKWYTASLSFITYSAKPFRHRGGIHKVSNGGNYEIFDMNDYSAHAAARFGSRNVIVLPKN